MARPRKPFNKLKRASVWTRNARADGKEGKMGNKVRHHVGGGNRTVYITRAEHNRVHIRNGKKRAAKAYAKRRKRKR